MKNNELLREEFEKDYFDYLHSSNDDEVAGDIADWWFSKFDSLKAELVRRFEKLPEAPALFSFAPLIHRAEAIKIVKEI